MKNQIIDFFQKNGYAVIDNIVPQNELLWYSTIYEELLSGKINTGKNRSDLGENLGTSKRVENITQIMWPSDFIEGIHQKPYHRSALQLAKSLLGSDLEMDFDMLINKAPHTDTITPWHQDAAYWVNMPDNRAVSCWMALDKATIENGCMWYVPKSHLGEIRSHQFAGKEGGALVCDGSEAEGIAVPLQAGSCVLHAGRTLHYSRGNSTDFHRRAWIINFRPKEMILLERSMGVDHARTGQAAERKIRNIG
ncbi:MAG: phytanoyl-CoA dioxygenase family protein [Saprospiraceae bacterium]